MTFCLGMKCREGLVAIAEFDLVTRVKYRG